MSNRFHNKWHRHNHHTDSNGESDGGYDPIASENDPFMGNFFLSGSMYLSASISVSGGNSNEWNSVYATVSAASSVWMGNFIDNVLIVNQISAGPTNNMTLSGDLTFYGNISSGTITNQICSNDQINIDPPTPTEWLLFNINGAPRAIPLYSFT